MEKLKENNMTAVEYLEKKLDDALSDTDYLTWKLVCEAVKEAKEMEKQQIIEAWIADDNELQRLSAEQYYETIFKK